MDAEDLYKRCLHMDDEAWGYVYAYVLHISRWPRWGLRESPEDMAQSIVLFLIERGIHEVRQPEAFLSFVKIVAKRKILDSFKKKKIAVKEFNPEMDPTHKKASGTNPSPIDPANPDDAISPEFIKIVTRALAHLPEYCRQVVPFYFKYKLGIIETFNELAETLGSPPGTVSAQITRCLRKLAEDPDLKDYHRED